MFPLLTLAALLATFFIMDTVLYLEQCHVKTCGPGSSVGIATEYGLEGLGSNPGGDETYHPFRPALGPTQPTVI